MVGRLNSSCNFFTGVFTLVLVVSVSLPSHAQRGKKKSDDKTKPESGYAYQTYSTLKKKEKKKGYSEESRFHIEKPLEPVPYGKIDRIVDYSKAPYFGHKRPPVRRPIGSTKLCRVCGIKH